VADTNTVIQPPPIPKVGDYPVALTIAGDVVATTILLIVAARFDRTNGVLTISLLVLMAFIAIVVFSVFFTIPTDEVTSAVIGGLVAAFGGIVGYWLGKTRNGNI
jgi:hypothetical protein